jgi:DNA-binding response OmpR family regulator
MEILQKAKVEVLREKRDNVAQNSLWLNDTYRFDTQAFLLYHKDGTLVPLSKKELELLQALIDSQGHIVTVTQCKEALWGDMQTSDATFRTLMKRLKDKIHEADFILSRKGQGYIIP